MFIKNEESNAYVYSTMQNSEKLILPELENKFYSVEYNYPKDIFLFSELNKYSKSSLFTSGKFGVLTNQIERFFRKSNFKARNELKLDHRMNMLIYGSTGTGKTHNIMSTLSSYLTSKNAIGLYITEKVPFSELSALITTVRHDKPECFIFLVFDEFEKTINYNQRRGGNPIQEILTFLDGGLSADNTIITAICNNIDDLPDTMLNRPGRFELKLEINELEDEVIIDFINTILPTNRKNSEFAKSVLMKTLALETKSIDYIKTLVYNELAELIEYEEIVANYK